MTVEFNDYLKIAAEVQGGIVGAIGETITAIEQDVKGKAPMTYPDAPLHGGALSARVVTGNLRRSYHQDRKNILDPLEPSAEIGSDPGIAEYAIWQEYGTSKMAPRPSLTPSSEAQRGPHEARVYAAVAKASGVLGIVGFGEAAAGASGAPAASGDA